MHSIQGDDRHLKHQSEVPIRSNSSNHPSEDMFLDIDEVDLEIAENEEEQPSLSQMNKNHPMNQNSGGR
jgi:hypothetical protein